MSEAVAISSSAESRAAGLPFWTGPVTLEPLGGGITNMNFVAEDKAGKFVVRIGDDIPVHGLMRFNELAASRAAHAAGISPEVVYAEPGALVLRFIEGKTFGPEDVRDQGNLEKILELVKICHRDVPRYVRGPALVFWVFHVVRDYAATLREGNSRHTDKLPRLLGAAEKLENIVGNIELVYGHNDLLAANFIDDGARLWLIDWDYAGFNSPLFDLGGLASNNEMDVTQEDWLLENYFETPVTDDLRRRYAAMKCGSLLRETMWSMVSEIHSDIEFDYPAYTAENLARFERALADIEGG